MPCACPPQGTVRYVSTLLLPLHREQSKTSRANVWRSSPAQSNRGVRALVDSSVAAGWGAAPSALAPPLLEGARQPAHAASRDAP